MAEVPEVEIIVRDLREAMVGRTIRSAEVIQPAAARFPAVDEFTTLLKDRTFPHCSSIQRVIVVNPLPSQARNLMVYQFNPCSQVSVSFLVQNRYCVISDNSASQHG